MLEKANTPELSESEKKLSEGLMSGEINELTDAGESRRNFKGNDRSGRWSCSQCESTVQLGGTGYTIC